MSLKKTPSNIKKKIQPKNFLPMLATLADSPPEGINWIYEIKWDGYRALAYCNIKNIKIISRNNKSFNEKFYPLNEELQKLNLNVVFDGEIVVLDEEGLASFSDLQNWRSEADGQLIYYIFDLLWLNGEDLTQKPLKERLKVLKKIFIPNKIIRLNEGFDGKNGKVDDFLKAVKELGLEGIIAKDANSLYYPGTRSKEWLKIKLQKRQEMVIGGYTVNADSKKIFSSLLVGVYENGKLSYTGKIGTGFTIKLQKEMMEQFQCVITKECPFSEEPDINKPSRFRPNPPHAQAVWLLPKLICEVNYTEMTKDGVMRHPSFKGMRDDKNALDVVEEIPQKSKKLSRLKQIVPSKKERKTLLNPSEDSQTKIIQNHELKFTHLNKIFWPQEGYTKRDLINYYYQAASFILPYLKNRPQSLNRFPNGIEGVSFYQKDVTKAAPEWMEKFPYHTSDGKDKNFLIVKNEDDLLWMANLGAIEMNPWNSTIKKPDNPDWCIIDIDPTPSNTFNQVIEVAQVTHKLLDELSIDNYCKTSGATGLHIYIPMGALYTYEQCQLFARLIATQVHMIIPKFTSIERLNINREGKIYIDFLQNRPKATLAAPYSVRPKPGATVSMPLHWSEVKTGFRPIQFTLKNALKRMIDEGDLFLPVLGKGVDIRKSMTFFNPL